MNIYTCLFLLLAFSTNSLFAEESNEATSTRNKTMDPELILAEGNQPPMVIFDYDEHVLLLTTEMESALDAYNPEFKAWTTSDYTKSILEGLKFESETSAPFAFVVDINGDNKRDVIIDGFNGKSPEIIVILSDGEDYKVTQVASLHTYSDPKLIKSFNDGVVEQGLNYLLWPNKNPDTQNVILFSVITPQETDIKGELLSDGSIVEFRFFEGEFISSSLRL